jgi:hypothetical protein
LALAIEKAPFEDNLTLIIDFKNSRRIRVDS